jgi:hypothetical protein
MQFDSRRLEIEALRKKVACGRIKILIPAEIKRGT